MIGENIKEQRIKSGMTQEAMAEAIGVVRQTVSKWERGFSVPSAEELIHIAALLGVSVNLLLGIEDNSPDENLSEQIQALEERLLIAEESMERQRIIGRKRGLILFLSFFAMLVSLAVKSPVLSSVLSVACVISAVVILYRNLTLLTDIGESDSRFKLLRLTIVFNITLVVVGLIFSLLLFLGVIVLPENGDKIFAMSLIVCFVIFTGTVAHKLPHSGHIGLRLPWTVADEGTWVLAHKILGVISLPIAMLYIACTFTSLSFELVTLSAILIWIGIPGAVSYVFYRRNFRGESKKK